MSSSSSSSSRAPSEHAAKETAFFSPAAVEKLRTRFSGLHSEGGGVHVFNPESDFSIDAHAVVLQEQLAKGSYGVVYAGLYNGEKVAVKIESLGPGEEEQVNVLTELTVLQSLCPPSSLSSPLHPRLVGYRGAGKLLKSPTEAKVCQG